ncbi:glycosyltransferase [Crenalkalicoccus roseus]|uniref:glycosyltransferase n=1 Tax=Crenalkalicoccus roseus TaxID=1485588 RepID=UPI0013050DCF|nr:glycosyltransferase [Crenalkalicoccus roseus]
MSGPQAAPRRLRRLLALLPSAGLGGAEAVTATLLRALAAEGVALHIAIESAWREGFAAMLGPGLAAAVAAAPIGWREAEAPERNLERQALFAAARLRAARPDAVLVPLPWPTHGLGFLAPLAAAGVPALAIAHLAPREPEPEAAALARAAPRGRLAWAAVSAPVAERLAACLGLPPGVVRVVPNGVAAPPPAPGARAAARRAKRALLGLPVEAPLFLFAGRLEPKKGADLLPGLAAALAERCGATLAALGEGPLRPALERQAGAALRLPGRVADVGEWLFAADALLLPSRLEGCPLVFLEAAARRCPVVASAAALEAFGEAAWDLAAIAAEGAVSALADQAAAILAAPEAARRRAEAAWRHAMAWDEQAMLGQYRSLLRAILD